jgi:hypothetical protein
VSNPPFYAQVNAFVEEADRQERWKADHDEAMACLHVESLVAFGIATYEVVDVVDRKIRLLIAQGKSPVRPSFWAKVDKAFESLTVATKVALRIAEKCERRGYAVDRIGRLREIVARLGSVAASRKNIDFEATE